MHATTRTHGHVGTATPARGANRGRDAAGHHCTDGAFRSRPTSAALMNSGAVFEREPGLMRARRMILTLGALLLMTTMVSAFFSISPMVSGQRALKQVGRDDLARHYVGELRTTLSDWQLFVEQRIALLSATAPKIDPVDLAKGTQHIADEQSQAQDLAKALRAMGLSAVGSNLEFVNAKFFKTVTDLAPLLAGASTASILGLIAAERTAFARMWSLTANAVEQVTQVTTADRQRATDHLGTGGTVVVVLDGLFATAVLIGTVVFGQRARQREHSQRTAMRRLRFETVLQQALDMSTAEPDVYDLLREAMPAAVPNLQVEMLVADSSRAHFRRTFHTADGAGERSGCGVLSPQECPATIRAHTLVFPSSRVLDACPYLKHRPSGDCSAVCVPVSVAGKTVGVTHATGADNNPPTEDDIRYLEIASRKASERVAMVRAFEKSEMQAHSDPLTGLLNRRSLEDRVRDLHYEATQYTLAYGDLDHFKILNDTYGHDAGDQALRMFATIMRDSVRPSDMVARYGGEEFVIVLPDCSTEVAIAVLERVRENLALTLTAGGVPAFTVSFGVTSSTRHSTFAETLAAADQALLAAKVAGRNRVILADRLPTDVPTLGTTQPGDPHGDPRRDTPPIAPAPAPRS